MAVAWVNVQPLADWLQTFPRTSSVSKNRFKNETSVINAEYMGLVNLYKACQVVRIEEAETRETRKDF